MMPVQPSATAGTDLSTLRAGLPSANGVTQRRRGSVSRTYRDLPHPVAPRPLPTTETEEKYKAFIWLCQANIRVDQ